MNTTTYCVFLILLVITTLAFLKYNIFMYENYETQGSSSCSLSVSQSDEVWRSFTKIKSIMTDLKEFPWPNEKSFLVLYTIYVTRLEYLLNTYGNKLSKQHLQTMMSFGRVMDIVDYYVENHNGLLKEVFEEMVKIIDIIDTNVSDTCPVCDPMHITQNLQIIDHEFNLYYSNLFPENVGDLDEYERKLLAEIEADMYNLTTMITNAIAVQQLDAKGRLDSSLIDAKIKDLNANFLLVSSSLNLFKFLQKSVDDIGSYIELKKLIVEDLKQCVLTPVVYDKCNFTGKSVHLIEGRYVIDELYTHYGIPIISSLQVPQNYNVVFHMKNGEVRVNNTDIPCLLSSTTASIDVITITLKKKQA